MRLSSRTWKAGDMTEREWLTCTEADRMLDFLGGEASERKLRLLTCANFRRLGDYLPGDRAREAAEIMERHADGLAREDEYYLACSFAKMAAEQALYADYPYLDLVWSFMRAVRGSLETWRFGTTCGFPSKEHDRSCAADLVREVSCHPCRRGVMNPAWLTPDAWTLAGHIYHDRAFACLPELADTLEAAGCSEPAVLEHCRGAGLHVAGCWVLDMVLGKAIMRRPGERSSWAP